MSPAFSSRGNNGFEILLGARDEGRGARENLKKESCEPAAFVTSGPVK